MVKEISFLAQTGDERDGTIVMSPQLFIYTAILCTFYWCFSIKSKIKLDESIFYLFLIYSMFAITFFFR